MTLPDLINGLFEFGAGLLIWHNVYRLYQDKIVKGVSWQSVLLFTSWAYYSLYYYGHLDQWMSLICATLIVTADTVWLLLYWRYRQNG